MRLTVLASALFASAFPIAAVSAEPPRANPAVDPARATVLSAMAAGGDAAGQASSLARIAWPAGKRDERVATEARIELTHFGGKALNTLREALNTVKVGYTDEVVATTLGAHANATVDMNRDHIPAMIDALWIGSPGAKTLAIKALASDRNALAVAPMIDSAIDDPTLAREVIETLGAMRFPQARFYLERVMMEGPQELRTVAASSLSQIGGAALAPLKNALKAPNRDARMLAARSLLPSATEYDVGAIYEYIEQHGDDDPGLTQALRTSADNIEKAIAARDAKESASSPKDF